MGLCCSVVYVFNEDVVCHCLVGFVRRFVTLWFELPFGFRCLWVASRGFEVRVMCAV